MDEHSHEQQGGDDERVPAPEPMPGDHAEGDEDVAEHERTGNPAVDEVLDSLDRLDDATLEEHVQIFEAAHEKLRGALADAQSDVADGRSGS